MRSYLILSFSILLSLSYFTQNKEISFDRVQAVVLAAGGSTRFNTGVTKLSAPICGQAMVLYPIKALSILNIPITAIIGFQKELVQNIIMKAALDNIIFVEQKEQRGTGHAVLCSQPTWHTDNILIMNGDMPLITTKIITALWKAHQNNNAVISFVIAPNVDPNGAYGRIVYDENHIEIVEAKHFTGSIHDYPFINAGIYLVNRAFLEDSLGSIEQNEQTNEFYLTDLVHIASKNNLRVVTIDVPFDRVRGVNTHRELADAENIKQKELIEHWMKNGVRFYKPETVRIDLNVTIGAGTTIGHGVHLLGNTTVGKFCHIDQFTTIENSTLNDHVTVYASSLIENSLIESHAQVGPYAHLRTQTHLTPYAEIGNFVEVKNSIIGQHTKAKHLTYIGDSEIGSYVNIGAGTITCNYDGIHKHKTIIEDNAFIGSNNCLVAPVTIGEGAYTASGSTITQDVPPKTLAIARAHQINKKDYGERLLTKDLTRPCKVDPSTHIQDQTSITYPKAAHHLQNTDETLLAIIDN